MPTRHTERTVCQLHHKYTTLDPAFPTLRNRLAQPTVRKVSPTRGEEWEKAVVGAHQQPFMLVLVNDVSNGDSCAPWLEHHMEHHGTVAGDIVGTDA